MSSHLSRPIVANGLKPPPESGRAGLCALPTVLLRIEFTAAVCLQPPGELLPHLSTLSSSRTSLSLTSVQARKLARSVAPRLQNRPASLGSILGLDAGREVVYFCCTCPEVAFGGRYPLSLPCGARTFLVRCFSACLPRLSDLLASILR